MVMMGALHWAIATLAETAAPKDREMEDVVSESLKLRSDHRTEH